MIRGEKMLRHLPTEHGKERISLGDSERAVKTRESD